MSKFSVEKFWPHSAETFRREQSLSVSLFSGFEKFGREGGVSRFPFELFLSHSAEQFRRGGGKFSVSFISGMEKVLIKG